MVYFKQHTSKLTTDLYYLCLIFQKLNLLFGILMILSGKDILDKKSFILIYLE